MTAMTTTTGVPGRPDPAGVVDVHVHWTPAAFLATGTGTGTGTALGPGAAASAGAADAAAGAPDAPDGLADSSLRPRVRLEGNRQVEVTLGGRRFDSVRGELSRLDLLLEEASHRGSGRVLLSPWVSTLPLRMAGEQAARHCREYNVAVAQATAAYRQRVRALAAVPIQSPELAAEVLLEAVSAGLVGAEVTPAVGNPYDTGLAAAHLVMAGVLERHPRLKVLLAHGGGTLPSVAARLGRAWQVRPESRAKLEAPPAESIALFYYDTVVHSQEALRGLLALGGPGQVMLGSDHPFDMGVDDPVAEVMALGMSTTDTAAVLRGNASRLLWAKDRSVSNQLHRQGGT